jgi:hypothetical protein
VYSVPASGVCGELTANVWFVPIVHVSICVLVYVVPSTVNDSPAGLVPTVTFTVLVSPVPFSVMLCVAVLAFNELSVNTAVLTMLPVVCGIKLILTLQLNPGPSVKLLLQSAGVPDPATCMKFVPTLNPGATALSV